VAFSTKAAKQLNQLAGTQHPVGHVVLFQKQHNGAE